MIRHASFIPSPVKMSMPTRTLLEKNSGAEQPKVLWIMFHFIDVKWDLNTVLLL